MEDKLFKYIVCMSLGFIAASLIFIDACLFQMVIWSY